MNQSVHPARPGEERTPDGRPMRQVQSYARRGSRFTPRQQAAWDEYAERWVIPDDALRAPADVTRAFGREAPLVIEIGPGVGEATGVLAAARPEVDVLALEVWLPGIAAGLAEVADAGATNVRFCSLDAVWALEHLVEPGGLHELWTFFPDPWPKTRHHKRRLVSPRFAALVASRLEPGGCWRLATDWADYAEQVAEVLGAEAAFTGGRVGRWSERPVTKFERKGIAADREIADFTYRRQRSPGLP